MPGTIVAWIALAAVIPASGEDVAHDFRSSRFDYRRFRFEGPNADDFIKPEAEGLRWRFGLGNAPDRPVGVYWNSRIKGDFGVRVEFELLKLEKPAGGSGVGAELYQSIEGPTKDAISVAYVMSSDGRPSLRFLHLNTDEEGERKTVDSRTVWLANPPGDGRISLQLTREGTTLTASVSSKSADQDLDGVIHQCEVPATDVLMSRFAGIAGKDKDARLDMRLLEFAVGTPDSPKLQIVSRGIVGMPVQAVPPPSIVAGTTRRSRSLFIAISVIGCLGVVTIVWWFMSLSTRNTSEPPSITKVATSIMNSTETAAPKVTFACRSCGAKLKADSEQRGLRMHCPRCHEQVLILE